MKKRSFKILREYYCPHGDFFLILGKSRTSKKTIAPYVIGYVQRWDDAGVVDDFARYTDLPSALEKFQQQLTSQDFPEDSIRFLEDQQQFPVYEWENEFVQPSSKPIKKSEAKALIKRVCDDTGMAVPRLVWMKPQDYSYYDDEEHAIYLGHHDACTVLHELAHARLAQDENSPEHHANHCPAFVWNVIELYNQYAGFSLPYLVRSAYGRDLLGPMKGDVLLAPKPDYLRAV